uniref:Putative ovule protein n=1 Tax=Solanum chacoense TaxID=4108 RepID=A0A0V0IQS8_SOLCH
MDHRFCLCVSAVYFFLDNCVRLCFMYRCSPKVAIRIPLTQSEYLVKKSEGDIPMWQCPFLLKMLHSKLCTVRAKTDLHIQFCFFFSFFKIEKVAFWLGSRQKNFYTNSLWKSNLLLTNKN